MEQNCKKKIESEKKKISSAHIYSRYVRPLMKRSRLVKCSDLRKKLFHLIMSGFFLRYQNMHHNDYYVHLQYLRYLYFHRCDKVSGCISIQPQGKFTFLFNL